MSAVGRRYNPYGKRGRRQSPCHLFHYRDGRSAAADGFDARRSAPGDDIWVSGCVGGAYAALKHRWGEWTLPAELYPAAAQRMDRPQARLALGRALLSSASACADVSDGLAQDLGHILERSGVAADILWDAVPLHPAVKPSAPTGALKRR